MNTLYKKLGNVVTAYIFDSYSSMRRSFGSDFNIALILDGDIPIDKTDVLKRGIINDVIGIYTIFKNVKI